MKFRRQFYSPILPLARVSPSQNGISEISAPPPPPTATSKLNRRLPSSFPRRFRRIISPLPLPSLLKHALPLIPPHWFPSIAWALPLVRCCYCRRGTFHGQEKKYTMSLPPNPPTKFTAEAYARMKTCGVDGRLQTICGSHFRTSTSTRLSLEHGNTPSAKLEVWIRNFATSWSYGSRLSWFASVTKVENLARVMPGTNALARPVHTHAFRPPAWRTLIS